LVQPQILSFAVAKAIPSLKPIACASQTRFPPRAEEIAGAAFGYARVSQEIRT
jgi:hypothetical protein